MTYQSADLENVFVIVSPPPDYIPPDWGVGHRCSR